MTLTAYAHTKHTHTHLRDGTLRHTHTENIWGIVVEMVNERWTHTHTKITAFR